MKYIEFFHAAERHYETCKQLKDDIENNCGDRTALLQNLYYLGGYVIECAYKYAIYKEVQFDDQKDYKLLNSKSTNQHHLPYRIFFEENAKQRKECETEGYKVFVINQVRAHTIKQGMDFFTNAHYANNPNLNIPILGGADMTPYIICNDLTENWSANTRYETCTFLTQEKVLIFFDLIEEVFKGVTTKFYLSTIP